MAKKTLADTLLNSLLKFLWMAGHPDKKNDYFIVVKVSLNNSRRKINGSIFEPSQNPMHMPALVIVSYDEFLSHLTIPPEFLF